MHPTLGKYAPTIIGKLGNIGFLFDHFGKWIKRHPDELANMLMKLKSLDTIILEWRERIYEEEVLNKETGEPETITYEYGKLYPTERIMRRDGMKSTYDWFDIIEEPYTEDPEQAAFAFLWYIESQPKLHHLRDVRIWFLYPRSKHDMRLLR
jgi:hypothetical protein